eukprot:gb/GEZJ01007109.1/.p2 GENE.gb/GEZJ01007109.1/~~gb/GEZJ01007109.1/.p2  ORF type:complete len:100 (-),score=10.63 gb/GEZJ01007109.1/:56-355(-)
MILYRSDIQDQVVDPELLQYAEHSETTYQTAEALKDIRRHGTTFEILVKWQGLPDHIDRTWEAIETIHQDLPDLLEDFLCTSQARKLKTEAQKLCKLVS